MTRKNLHHLLLAIPISTLAACGGGGGDNAPPPSPPTSITAQEDTFGVVFGMAFRADANSEPIEPKDGDIIPLTLTEEPKEIN